MTPKKKILPPLLRELEPGPFDHESRRRSNHWHISLLSVCEHISSCLLLEVPGWIQHPRTVVVCYCPGRYGQEQTTGIATCRMDFSSKILYRLRAGVVPLPCVVFLIVSALIKGAAWVQLLRTVAVSYCPRAIPTAANHK